jgi:hypothetical protein
MSSGPPPLPPISYPGWLGQPLGGSSPLAPAGPTDTRIPAEPFDLWGVDPPMRAADEAAGLIVNGSYVRNPSAQNLASLVNEHGKIRDARMSGQYMYVVTSSGDIIIGTRSGQRMPHPTLVGGAEPQVRAAGIVDIRGGKIFSVDNGSGHFKPGADCLRAADEAFRRLLPEKAFHRDYPGPQPFRET